MSKLALNTAFTLVLAVVLSGLELSPALASIPPGPFGPNSQLLASPVRPPEATAPAATNAVKAPTGSSATSPSSIAVRLELGCADLRRNALRMSVHASNLANRETTRTPTGGTYKRLEVVCKAAGGAFCNVESFDDVKLLYSPGHPDADVNGYVKLPSINAGSEAAGLNLAATELKVLANQGVCGTKGIQEGLMTIVKYQPDFDVMMDTMTFTADGRISRWSRTTRDGRTQNLSFKEDGTPVGL